MVVPHSWIKICLKLVLGGWEEYHLLHPGGGEVLPSKLIDVPWSSKDPWINTLINVGGGPTLETLRRESYIIYDVCVYIYVWLKYTIIKDSPVLRGLWWSYYDCWEYMIKCNAHVVTGYHHFQLKNHQRTGKIHSQIRFSENYRRICPGTCSRFLRIKGVQTMQF